jgi:hypothetical protein
MWAWPGRCCLMQEPIPKELALSPIQMHLFSQSCLELTVEQYKVRSSFQNHHQITYDCTCGIVDSQWCRDYLDAAFKWHLQAFTQILKLCYTVNIWILDYSGIEIVHTCVVVEWSVFVGVSSLIPFIWNQDFLYSFLKIKQSSLVDHSNTGQIVRYFNSNFFPIQRSLLGPFHV